MPGSRARSSRRSTVVRSTLLALAVALGAAGCSGDPETPQAPESQQRPASTAAESTTPAPPSPSPQRATDRPTPAPRWPLTGRPADHRSDRSAAVVKIENTASSEPQRGLGAADLVVEQLVEGGLIRLAAFYHSRLPTRVGPVRSMRATDIGLVKPTRGVLVASGGAPPTVRRARAARIRMAMEGTAGFSRSGNRPAPYNLFVDLRRLPKDKLAGPAPRPYLPWGSAERLRGGRPATRVSAQFSGGSTTSWTWRGRGWRRADSHAARGDEFVPDTLLVLRVRQTDAGYLDPAGNPVPKSVLTGTGAATVLHRGRAYAGSWAKRSVASPLRLRAAGGRPLVVPPGRTWVELLPTRGGDLRVRG